MLQSLIYVDISPVLHKTIFDKVEHDVAQQYAKGTKINYLLPRDKKIKIMTGTTFYCYIYLYRCSFIFAMMNRTS